MVFARIAVVVVLVLGRTAAAEEAPVIEPSAGACDPREAEELRTHLTAQARKASKWNFAWRLTFTTAAVGTFGVALANPFPELRTGLWVSSGKASLGALARWFTPLNVSVPEPNSDACADVKALRAAVTKTAKKQRALFWTGHIGGILVNAAGAIIIAKTQSLGQGLLSVAVGYPIGLLSNYTMPRGSWNMWRERDWTITVQPGKQAWLVSIAGEL